MLIMGTVIIAVSSSGADNWKSLKEDGLHDPANPSLEIMQAPTEALGVLAPDTAGNKVDWVQALQSGQISPRSSLNGKVEPEILDLDVVMKATTPLPYVIFPHRPHTEWMSCDTCHEEMFISENGANPISMGSILQGEHCGRCHGTVSFPLTECNRCHSVKSNSPVAPSSGAAREPAR